MTSEEFTRKVKESEQHVHNMDRIDGFSDRDLITILFALEAGIKNPETGAQFDAYVMLKDRIMAKKG